MPKTRKRRRVSDSGDDRDDESEMPSKKIRRDLKLGRHSDDSDPPTDGDGDGDGEDADTNRVVEGSDGADSDADSVAFSIGPREASLSDESDSSDDDSSGDERSRKAIAPKRTGGNPAKKPGARIYSSNEDEDGDDDHDGAVSAPRGKAKETSEPKNVVEPPAGKEEAAFDSSDGEPSFQKVDEEARAREAASDGGGDEVPLALKKAKSKGKSAKGRSVPNVNERKNKNGGAAKEEIHSDGSDDRPLSEKVGRNAVKGDPMPDIDDEALVKKTKAEARKKALSGKKNEPSAGTSARGKSESRRPAAKEARSDSSDDEPLAMKANGNATKLKKDRQTGRKKTVKGKLAEEKSNGKKKSDENDEAANKTAHPDAVDEPLVKVVDEDIAKEGVESDDDDEPLAKKRNAKVEKAPPSKKKEPASKKPSKVRSKSKNPEGMRSDSSDEEPLAMKVNGNATKLKRDRQTGRKKATKLAEEKSAKKTVHSDAVDEPLVKVVDEDVLKEESECDDEEPLAKKTKAKVEKAPPGKKKEPASKKTSKVKSESKWNIIKPKNDNDSDADSYSDDDEPLAKKAMKNKNPSAKSANKESESSCSDAVSETGGGNEGDDRTSPKERAESGSGDDEPLAEKKAENGKLVTELVADVGDDTDDQPPATDGSDIDEKAVEKRPKLVSPRRRSDSSSGVSDISLIDDIAEKPKEAKKKAAAKPAKKPAAKSESKAKTVSKGSKKKKNGDGEEGKENRGAAAEKKVAAAKKKSDGGLVRLKKCAYVAGLRLNFVKLFENVPKLQDQKRKIMDLLEAEALDGAPTSGHTSARDWTLEKCEKLRVRRETKAEVSALDLNNIIDEKVRRGSTPASRRRESSPAETTKHFDEDSEDEVQGRRILKLNPALFDEDDSD